MVYVVAFLIAPFLLAWTPACLALQAAEPGERRRELWRQPGFIACLIALELMVMALASGTSDTRIEAGGLSELMSAMLPGFGCTGMGVLAGWAAMKYFNAWHPVPSWKDRLGRLTGGLWVIGGAICIADSSWPPA